ncbi:hypothetical protein SLNWT_2293 [Streptomyces albus]|uniref:Uncharacterized protein n=1 Tax=Streptomyces albus (strain ATCC 21838 / DSM 41398 / FERM P-419 / JCM 4703 / NBRC 107858) TaxID=1081613 RepID=A0A0B5EM77_STRA4|nr:hypothetical protein SLNWT_2293 [Streptomyces albus]AOU76982.1 hypothetical protein SLNHY_2291 [Streptomyces albus]AYN32758.1 hypothetical protein DUI70_2255 [Streptomyces albus]
MKAAPDARGGPVVSVNTVCPGRAPVDRASVGRASVSRADYRW